MGPPSGEIDILIGMNYAELQPTKKVTVGSLVLYKSSVKAPTSIILGGTLKSSDQGHQQGTCCLVMGESFWTSEDLGIAAPRACQNCRSCRECDFISSQLSFKEAEELEVIKENLTHDQKQE